MPFDKTAAYRQLVQNWKTCRVCSGLTNAQLISSNGTCDTDQIEPWSPWQGYSKR